MDRLSSNRLKNVFYSPASGRALVASRRLEVNERWRRVRVNGFCFTYNELARGPRGENHGQVRRGAARDKMAAASC